MGASLRASSVAPMGLKVESMTAVEAGIVVVAKSEVAERPCPVCGRASRRVHSRYVRTIADLPCGGRRVELRLRARRFVCRTPFCPRRIFAERFEAAHVASVIAGHIYSTIQHYLGLGKRLVVIPPEFRLICDGADRRWPSMLCERQ